MTTEGKYSAIDVSRHVINYCDSKGLSIGNLKLQKLLYFIQASFLVRNRGKQSCFSDPIQAWAYGPVVPAVYDEYKIYGSSNIPKITTVLSVEEAYPNYYIPVQVPYKDEIDPQDASLIDQVVEKFKDYSAYDLVDLTHKQSPWIDAYESDSRSEQISCDAIYNFFVAD